MSRITTSRTWRFAASTPFAGDVDDGGADRCAVDRDVELATERLELVGGSRPVRVGRHEQRAAALLDDVPGQLGGRGGLARALQADHRHDRGVAGQVEYPVPGRQELDELVVHDLHDLLAGGEALEHIGTDRAFPNARHEVLDDLEVDVRLEQRQADLAHGGVDVGLADPAAAGQAVERLAQSLAEGVEHGRVRSSVSG